MSKSTSPQGWPLEGIRLHIDYIHVLKDKSWKLGHRVERAIFMMMFTRPTKFAIHSFIKLL